MASAQLQITCKNYRLYGSGTGNVSCSRDDVTRTGHKTIGSSRCGPYISTPTLIVNGLKERLPSLLEHWYSPKKHQRRLKLARELAKIPFYIEACSL